MVYQIGFKPAAIRDLKNIPKTDQKRIARKIDSLAKDSRPPGAMKLRHAGNLRRIKAGDYRILYQIDEKASLVLIAKIRHRREVYRNL